MIIVSFWTSSSQNKDPRGAVISCSWRSMSYWHLGSLSCFGRPIRTSIRFGANSGPMKTCLSGLWEKMEKTETSRAALSVWTEIVWRWIEIPLLCEGGFTTEICSSLHFCRFWRPLRSLTWLIWRPQRDVLRPDRHLSPFCSKQSTWLFCVYFYWLTGSCYAILNPW